MISEFSESEIDINEKKIENPDMIQSINIHFSNFINEQNGSYTDNYKLGGVLGSGSFGQVRKVTHRKTKIVRAMKVVEKAKLSKNEQKFKFINEINILRKLDHPNIIKIFEFYQDEKNLYIIIEMCAGGELFEKVLELGSFSEKEASYVMKEIIGAVMFAHSHLIVHRDLKPENILLDISIDGGYHVKVVDWGSARFFKEGEKLSERFGTPYYIAPEVLKETYDFKCDIWSCGVILYILITGTPPFKGKTDKEILRNIIKGYYSLSGKDFECVSPAVKDLIPNMLCYKPEFRFSAKEVLSHDWFKLMAEKINVNEENMISNLKNLREFRADQNLKKAALTFIATQLISKDERQQLIETFKTLDENNDGVLSEEEIVQGFSQMMSIEEAKSEAHKIMESVDLDHSGFIDYSEFIIASLDRKKLLTKEKLEAAFKNFDKNGDGTITLEEIKSSLGGYLANMTEASFQNIINEVDINGDGEISFEEFSQMMLKCID